MKKILIILIAVVVIAPSCRFRHRRHSGNGHVATEQRTIASFNAVESHGSIDIELAQGTQAIKVEADDDIIKYIETVVENGTLKVRFKESIDFIDFDHAKVWVTVPELSRIETHGSGDVKADGKVTAKDRMEIKVFGSGDVDLALDAPSVRTETHGSGNMTLRGETREVDATIQGSGDLNADELKSEKTTVSIHGSGNADVYASVSLQAEISGSGDVHYKGSPSVNSNVHGSGSVSKMD